VGRPRRLGRRVASRVKSARQLWRRRQVAAIRAYDPRQGYDSSRMPERHGHAIWSADSAQTAAVNAPALRFSTSTPFPALARGASVPADRRRRRYAALAVALPDELITELSACAGCSLRLEARRSGCAPDTISPKSALLRVATACGHGQVSDQSVVWQSSSSTPPTEHRLADGSRGESTTCTHAREHPCASSHGARNSDTGHEAARALRRRRRPRCLVGLPPRPAAHVSFQSCR